MSGNGDEDKTEPGKTFPLDLAAKITTVKSVDCKTPLIMTGQALRNMRVLTPSSAVQTSLNTGNILTTNILSQAVLKQGEINRSQGTNLANTSQPQQSVSSNVIQRPTQITLTASLPVVAQSPTGTYHVPRGPAVVANLAAPRSNVAAAIRNPMIVNTQTVGQSAQAYVRPPRTPSPAQGTAWLTTNSSNGSQIKGAPTVLSSPVRGASVSGVSAIGKPQIVARTQAVTQTVSSVRPTATILHSAITIGQGGQIHPFKSGQSNTGIQALTNNTVTLAQVLPARTQTLVYSTGGNTAHLAAPPRIAVSTNIQNRQSTTPKTMNQVTTTRLTMPVNVTAATRLVTPQGTVLTTGTRLTTTTSTQQATLLGSTAPARIVSTTQPAVAIGRVAVTPTQSSSASNVIGQSRISTLSLHPLVVANTSQPRTIQTQGAKVITQTAQGTAIHLTQMPATIKPTQTIVTTASRTINVQPIVTQRTVPSVSSQAIPIAKVFSPQAENQPVVTPSAGVFIHAPPVAAVSRRSSPGPTSVAAATTVVTTGVATYSIASGTYFYDATGTYSVAHSFNQSSFATVPQSTNQQIKPAIAPQVHGIVTNQQMRFNPVMVLEQNRVPQYSQSQQSHHQDTGHEQSQVSGGPSAQIIPTQTQKVTSSPRPSILRKRDHEGSPLKAAKNLNSSLVSAIIPQQNVAPPPISPPSRPDSGGNGNSSGGSTTVSATSSPGMAETNEDSMPHVPSSNKDEEESNRPPTEMSPRKKPRKQQFGTGSNDLDENMNDDMQFITDGAVTKKDADSDENRSDGKEEMPSETRVVRKPATPSLLNSYRQTWKATHNHYLRYSDVRPKDERRPTIMDLANQCRVLDKVNGWKIHHLSTQMEDLADEEQAVYDQLTRLLKFTEAEEKNSNEREINHINELIKGNLQRIKIINDGMVEAKSQIMKIFDHKVHVTDIINRCASKRNFKKREKS
ncbi:histone deacetylase complex subunit SAP130-A [Agrilus planipennis]|uniref:Histone deacetylase complex subunit SAP130-A n=1 Tax=Agrilus planipennis TaxID=224129 RepID=A0A1W4WP96_AGRPL|nr:histone deacetylase complex subunit SAP130-A [Agrilus planipennis]XP_018325749.1 histone deacetylase complex subunit SAP130-A [Agrilus planipennis]